MRKYFLITLLLASFFASGQNVDLLPTSVLPLDTASWTMLRQPAATSLRKASLNRIFLTGKNYYDALYRPISYVPSWASITDKPNFDSLYWKTGGTSVLTDDVTIDGDNETHTVTFEDVNGVSVKNASSEIFISPSFGISTQTGSAYVGINPESILAVDASSNQHFYSRPTFTQIANTFFLYDNAVVGRNKIISQTGGGVSSTGLELDATSILIPQPSAAAAGHELLLRTNGSNGQAITKLGIGSGLSISGGNLVASGGGYTDEQAQDAVGAMVDASLVYNDATPSLSRAALTGAITASAGSNTTSLGSFTVAQLSTAISDANISGTNTGDQTSIVGITGTKAQFNTAVTDGDFLYVGDALTSEVDGSISNEGSLTVAAGTGTTSIINSNTSGSTGVTITAGTGLSIAEAGNVITLTNTGVITEVDGSTTNELQTISHTSDATSHTATLSASGGSLKLIEGSGVTLTTSGNEVTIAASGGGGGDMLASTYDPANIAQQVVGTTATQTVTNKNMSTGSSWTGNQIGATYGGTGQVLYTAGDILYAAGPSSLLKLSIGSTGDVLTVSGGALPVWQAPSGGGSGLTYAQVKALKFK